MEGREHPQTTVLHKTEGKLGQGRRVEKQKVKVGKGTMCRADVSGMEELRSLG